MNSRMSHSLAGCLFAAAILTGTAARADLVVNGGFETGNFTGWTQFGDTSLTAVNGIAAHTGSFGAAFGNPTSGGIFQTLATAPGQSYDVSFFIRQVAGSTNTFNFNWDGGAPEWSLVNVIPGFATFDFTLTASSSTTDLRFTFSNIDAVWYFDDVSVTAVPEPATLALLGIGLAGLGSARRKQ